MEIHNLLERRSEKVFHRESQRIMERLANIAQTYFSNTRCATKDTAPSTQGNNHFIASKIPTKSKEQEYYEGRQHRSRVGRMNDTTLTYRRGRWPCRGSGRHRVSLVWRRARTPRWRICPPARGRFLRKRVSWLTALLRS